MADARGGGVSGGVSDLIDDRPDLDADLFSYRPLPADDGDCMPVWREMWQKMVTAGAEEIRATLVNAEFEKPPYPHGLYLEGWLVAPHNMKTPHKAAPFHYPLTREGQP